MSDVDSVSGDTAKLLKDVTGETRLDSAVRSTVKDALKHRLEKIDEELENLEKKYGMSFEDFEEAWENDDVEDKHSYSVEKDYWRWEGLVTRKQKINRALQRLEK